MLSEVEPEQRPGGNGDHQAIVVGAGLCDGEGDRAYTVYDTPFFSDHFCKILHIRPTYVDRKTIPLQFPPNFLTTFDLPFTTKNFRLGYMSPLG